MRIGICGAQGTGKTTLALALSGRLGLPLVQEQARVVAHGMGLVSEDALRAAPAEIQIRFQQRCLDQQVRAEQALSFSGFVSDRTTIDNACYWLAWNHARANFFEGYDYLKRCKEHATTYDLIIYCPPLPWKPEDDGFRMTNPVYRDEIDMLVRTLLLGWEIPRWVRVEGSPEEMLSQALAAVQEVRVA